MLPGLQMGDPENKPQHDPWVENLLGEDPEQIESLDPYIPEEWRGEPGFILAERLGILTNPAAEVAKYENSSRFRAEHRIGHNQLNYIVLFLKDEAE
jgi:hypothetical protein